VLKKKKSSYKFLGIFEIDWNRSCLSIGGPTNTPTTNSRSVVETHVCRGSFVSETRAVATGADSCLIWPPKFFFLLSASYFLYTPCTTFRLSDLADAIVDEKLITKDRRMSAYSSDQMQARDKIQPPNDRSC